MSAMTLAVASGRSIGFRPAATHRRAAELLRGVVDELADQGVTATGCASVSVVSVDDAGVGIEVGVVVDGDVVHDRVVETDTLRVVERPGHAAATLLVSGEQSDPAWAELLGFVGDVGLRPAARPYVSFQHPRVADARSWFTQLVQPVVVAD